MTSSVSHRIVQPRSPGSCSSVLGATAASAAPAPHADGTSSRTASTMRGTAIAAEGRLRSSLLGHRRVQVDAALCPRRSRLEARASRRRKTGEPGQRPRRELGGAVDARDRRRVAPGDEAVVLADVSEPGVQAGERGTALAGARMARSGGRIHPGGRRRRRGRAASLRPSATGSSSVRSGALRSGNPRVSWLRSQKNASPLLDVDDVQGLGPQFPDRVEAVAEEAPDVPCSRKSSGPQGATGAGVEVEALSQIRMVSSGAVGRSPEMLEGRHQGLGHGLAGEAQQDGPAGQLDDALPLHPARLQPPARTGRISCSTRAARTAGLASRIRRLHGSGRGAAVPACRCSC